jgi:SWI/SNF-related matrix-associated actin-dependent regulator 1 of chromatin subfamily A
MIFWSWNELVRDTTSYLAHVRRWQPDMLVLDEAHYAKDRKAKRTQAVYGHAIDGGSSSLIHGVPMVLALSGTPAPNFTSELWTHLNALAPHTILRANGVPLAEHQFRELYSHQKTSNWGYRVVGSKNTEQLRERTRGFFRRLLKEHVLPDLPSLMVVEEPLDVDMGGIPPEFRDPALAGTLSDEELVKWLNDRAPSLAGARRLLGGAKTGPAIAWIEEFLQSSDRKLVVFAHHLGVIEQIVNSLKGAAVAVTGATPTKVRQAAVHLFQNDLRVRVFVGQTQASGTGLTLTAAHDVMVLEPDWTPATIAQAIQRTHRIGQKNAVLARMMYAPGTLDEVIGKVMARKTRDLQGLFESRENAA